MAERKTLEQWAREVIKAALRDGIVEMPSDVTDRRTYARYADSLTSGDVLVVAQKLKALLEEDREYNGVVQK